MRKYIVSHSTAITLIIGVVGVGIIIYPELRQLASGEEIGGGISTLIVGALALLLMFGLLGIGWATRKLDIRTAYEDMAYLALALVIILGNVIVILYIPDSLEAVGLLVVTVLVAAFVLRSLLWRPSPRY